MILTNIGLAYGEGTIAHVSGDRIVIKVYPSETAVKFSSQQFFDMVGKYGRGFGTPMQPEVTAVSGPLPVI